MNYIDPVLVVLIPVLGFIASISCLVLSASTFGAKQPVSIRFILWAVAVSFAGMAVQNVIVIAKHGIALEVIGPSVTLMLAVNVFTKLLVIIGVVATLHRFDQIEYEKRGHSVFWKDLAITTRPADQTAQTNIKESCNV